MGIKSAFVFVFAVFVVALPMTACQKTDRCLSVCQQREKALGCVPETKSGTCKAMCDELHEQTPCSAAMRSWEDCLVALPVDQWMCNTAGSPAPKETACTTARAGVIDCISQNPPAPHKS
ncbi:MAG TPA: hypothetical protein VHJ20_05490 [Polyangia bacterium]|nr:hypothetical protein [Polyangia bacterium]